MSDLSGRTLIETDRLVLRRSRLADIDDVYAYQRLPDVAKYLYRAPLTRDEVRDRLKRSAQGGFETAGDELEAMVELRDQPGVIGEVVLKWASSRARQAEVGYVFNPSAAGHGYATEAAREMLRLGFERFGFHRIFARLDAENLASANVCRRLGMRREAHLVENDMRDGEWGSELVFAILDREWTARTDL